MLIMLGLKNANLIDDVEYLLPVKFLEFHLLVAEKAFGIPPSFYGTMNIHRDTVISAIVTLHLLFCILHFNVLCGSATLLYKSHLE